MERKRLVIACCIIVAFALLCIGLVLFAMNRGPNAQKTKDSPTTVSGTLACLPPKDSQGGPHTLECAIGLHTEDGRYYALQNLPQSATTTDFNRHIQISGTLSPPLADDKYQTQGTIKVVQLQTN